MDGRHDRTAFAHNRSHSRHTVQRKAGGRVVGLGVEAGWEWRTRQKKTTTTVKWMSSPSPLPMSS